MSPKGPQARPGERDPSGAPPTQHPFLARYVASVGERGEVLRQYGVRNVEPSTRGDELRLVDNSQKRAKAKADRRRWPRR